MKLRFNRVNMNRRKFIRNSTLTGGISMIGPSVIKAISHVESIKNEKEITIKHVDSNFEREPLIRPFGFKGGYMTEIWQTASLLESDEGIRKVGLCSQNVLWSDARVFANHSESGGNALMYAITEYALSILPGRTFVDPIELLDDIISPVYEYAQSVTNNPDLRKTFVLNK